MFSDDTSEEKVMNKYYRIHGAYYPGKMVNSANDSGFIWSYPIGEQGASRSNPELYYLLGGDHPYVRIDYTPGEHQRFPDSYYFDKSFKKKHKPEEERKQSLGLSDSEFLDHQETATPATPRSKYGAGYFQITAMYRELLRPGLNDTEVDDMEPLLNTIVTDSEGRKHLLPHLGLDAITYLDSIGFDLDDHFNESRAVHTIKEPDSDDIFCEETTDIEDEPMGYTPEDEIKRKAIIQQKVMNMIEQETDISDSDKTELIGELPSVDQYRLRTLRKKLREQGDSPVNAHIVNKWLNNVDNIPDDQLHEVPISKKFSAEGFIAGANVSNEKYITRLKRRVGKQIAYPYLDETPEQKSKRKSFPKRDLDYLTGDSEDSATDDSLDISQMMESDKVVDDSETPESAGFIKKVKPNDFTNRYVTKESMFWIEILQRGRTMAREFGMNLDFCNRTRMSGLTFVEWFGFLDKYYSELPALNRYKSKWGSSMDNFNTWMEDPDRDPRFRKPTGHQLSSLFPEFEQALKNSNLKEAIQEQKDPRILAYNLRKFISSYSATNTSAANFSNPTITKPSSVQHEYLAKLLTRVSSTEMKQVIEKKLYQEAPPPMTDEAYCEDLVSRALAEVVKSTEYAVTPAYNVPDEFLVPCLQDEIDDILESDEDHPNTRLDKETRSVLPNTGEDDVPDNPALSEESRDFEAEKRTFCRVCKGKQLEPMNGPFLLQLIDDVGKILPRRFTGLCVRHQKKIGPVVRRSINMGVLDWSRGYVQYLDPFQPEAYPGEIPFPTDVRKGGKNTK